VHGFCGNTEINVFNGATPNLFTVLSITGEESQLWGMAGAKGLFFLNSFTLGPG